MLKIVNKEELIIEDIDNKNENIKKDENKLKSITEKLDSNYTGFKITNLNNEEKEFEKTLNFGNINKKIENLSILFEDFLKSDNKSKSELEGLDEMGLKIIIELDNIQTENEDIIIERKKIFQKINKISNSIEEELNKFKIEGGQKCNSIYW
jgi:hypothetical protein